jgi:plasmid stability protein
MFIKDGNKLLYVMNLKGLMHERGVLVWVQACLSLAPQMASGRVWVRYCILINILDTKHGRHIRYAPSELSRSMNKRKELVDMHRVAKKTPSSIDIRQRGIDGRTAEAEARAILIAATYSRRLLSKQQRAAELARLSYGHGVEGRAQWFRQCPTSPQLEQLFPRRGGAA